MKRFIVTRKIHGKVVNLPIYAPSAIAAARLADEYAAAENVKKAS